MVHEQRSPAVAPVRERVLRFLAEHRKQRYSVQEIARAVGCSRQYVYSVLPKGYEPKRSTLTERLQVFVDKNPQAILPKARGGMTLKEIAERLGANPEAIGRQWRELKLPDRAQFKLSERERNHRSYERRKERHRAATRAWAERNREKARAISRASRRRWLTKVIREARCIVCGRTFPWTNAREQGRKRRGRRVVCSRSCAAFAWRRLATPKARSSTNAKSGTRRPGRKPRSRSDQSFSKKR